MEKHLKKALFLFSSLLAVLFSPAVFLQAAEIRPGSIYLQVEQHGEAWYLHPLSRERFYLGRPADAWDLLREQGLGISNDNLKKIPLGVLKSAAPDTDGDGLSDDLEKALGTNPLLPDSDADGLSDYDEIARSYNPLGPGMMPIDLAFSRRYSGYIFLQVQARGEAWYVNPADAKRYYLGKKEDAFDIMRLLGAGISNSDLAKIKISGRSAKDSAFLSAGKESETVNGVDLRQLEFLATELINHERLKAGLQPLAWNRDLAAVAREHSQNLADENKAISGFNKACDFPIIHHEGIGFGPYNSDRLKARGVHYYSKAGENIALISAGKFSIKFFDDSPAQAELDNCAGVRAARDQDYERKLAQASGAAEKIGVIERELKARQVLYSSYHGAEVAAADWYGGLELAREALRGWMNSPGHKDNIMNRDYDEAGVGVSYIQGYMILTQVFIKRAACGYLAGPCCVESGYRPYCYLPLQCGPDKWCLES